MSKKTIRIISIMFTVVLVLMLATSTIFAVSSPSGVNSSVTVNGLNKVEDVGNQVVTTIRTVGIFVSVAILMVLGIKYMVGSAEEKASYKKTMMPYLVGAILIFAASTLAEAIFNIVKNI